VRDLFERYEQAVDRQERRRARRHVLEQPVHEFATRSPRTATASARSTRIAWRDRRLGTKEKADSSEILTLGRDLATVNLEFKVRAAS